MMSVFDQYIDRFECSRPIFKLTINTTGIDCKVAYQYRPTSLDDNPIEVLACNAFNERFDISSKKFVIDKSQIKTKAVSSMIGELLQIVESNLRIKKPRQSALYKWLWSSCYGTPDDLANSLASVYSYAKSKLSTTTWTHNGFRFDEKDLDHANNVLAILELLRKKYERKDQESDQQR